MMQGKQKQPIYSKLAQIYDHIMRDVDYVYWAEYIDELLHLHHRAYYNY